MDPGIARHGRVAPVTQAKVDAASESNDVLDQPSAVSKGGKGASLNPASSPACSAPIAICTGEQTRKGREGRERGRTGKLGG